MSKTITDEKVIDAFLDRGIIKTILPTKEEFKSLLMSGKKIRIYIGFDATANTLHLSHAKNIMLLEEFRKLGHEVVLLFGDFTARIGDPSDQHGTRKTFTEKEVLKNIKDWKEQIKNLMNFKDKKNPPKILFNSKWLAKMNMEKVLGLAANVTVQQMIERDMFQKRMKEGKHIFLHEFLYPLMQGYDSVAMEVDVELCGTDQIFNALMGRTLLRKLKNKDKFVVAVNLMENPKTGELMSKSRGTGVFLNTTANEMYGGIMAQPDEMIKVFLINCTKLSILEIDNVLSKNDTMTAKKITAKEVVMVVHGEKKAVAAQDNWEKTFSKKEIPTEIESFVAKKGDTLINVFLDNKIIASKNEFRRLVESGAVTSMENNQKILTPNEVVSSGVYKIGKKRFCKIEIK
ncbi:tyrosine--tRNA ligase [Candidatus Nomurabacteria bacterium]|nr:tyrosine--tRNA ligase [Candidatus Nomurabacteria bacterium]